jgi:lysophospholipase L1-like esterase
VGTVIFLFILKPDEQSLRRRWALSSLVFFILAIELTRTHFNTTSHYLAADWYSGLTSASAVEWFDPDIRVFDATYTQDEKIRRRDVPIAKGKRVRVLLMGGSQTFGQYINNWDRTMAGYLEKQIRETRGDVQVINAGYGSATSFSQLVFFHSALHHFKPDIVLLNVGANDSLLWRGDIDHLNSITRHKMGILRKLSNVSMTVMLAREIFSSSFLNSVHLMGKRQQFFMRNVREFGRLQKPMGFKLFLVKEITADICDSDGGSLNPFLKGAEHGAGFPFMAKNDVSLILPGPTFCKFKGEPLYLDGVHLTPKGHELLAKILYESISPTLKNIPEK